MLLRKDAEGNPDLFEFTDGLSTFYIQLFDKLVNIMQLCMTCERTLSDLLIEEPK